MTSSSVEDYLETPNSALAVRDHELPTSGSESSLGDGDDDQDGGAKGAAGGTGLVAPLKTMADFAKGSGMSGADAGDA